MILDIIIIAFFLIFVIIGIKRGAARTLLNLVALGVSVFLASVFGSAFAQWIYNSFFQSGIVQSLNSAMTASGASDSLQSALDAIPDYVYSALSFAGITKDSLLSQTEHAASSSQTEIAQTIEGIISPVLTSIISFFTVIILFLLLMILLKFLIKFILNIFELPGLHMLNRMAGAVLGFAEGVIFTYLIIVLLKLVLPFAGEDFIITQQLINESIIFRAMYGLDIFSGISQLSSSVSMLTGKR